jgi:hypothetical protein
MWNVDKIIDRAGEWNAQLFRELKGRVTLRNMFLAGMLSVGCQLMLLLTFILQFPTNPQPGESRRQQTYCILESITASNGNGGFYDQQVCQLNLFGQVSIDWPHWWTAVWSMMSWVLPVILFTGGVYLLTSDLRRETRRGTLNFLRLSPQSAPDILVGKLLGVPVLVYLAVAIALPLHFLAAWSSGFGVVNEFAWYGLTATMAGVFYAAATLITLATPSAPIVITFLTLWISSSMLSIPNWALSGTFNSRSKIFESLNIYWFFFSITQNTSFFYLFGMGSCLVAFYWLWQSICRRYREPNSTLLAKKSSYQLNFCWQAWLAGFGLPIFIGSYGSTGNSTLTGFLGGVLFCQICAAFVAIFVLTPQRQNIEDWSRYRRESERKKLWQQEIWQDLLWDDRSPAVLAIAVNLAIALAVWLPWCPFALANSALVIKAILAAIITAVLLLNYGILAQIVLITKKKWQWQQAIFYVALLTLLPMMGAAFAAALGWQSIAMTLITLASPLAVFGIWQMAGGTLLLGIIIQPLLLFLATARLQYQILKIGKSETQAFLSII